MTLAIPLDSAFLQQACVRLAEKYHPDEPRVHQAATQLSAEQFLRLFLTAHGMRPVGNWQTHTYVRCTDSATLRDHFFLIPLPRASGPGDSSAAPNIRMIAGRVWIDALETPIVAQSIPHTTPFWYFHYDPNSEDRPYLSMTLNLKPACPEKCTLCAGAKTGRVNNGLEGTLAPHSTLDLVLEQHAEARTQLESVAVVTGCFDQFDDLVQHLREVRAAVSERASPRTYRVLEHNVSTPEQFQLVVGELGYEVFITLECYDPQSRFIALNGKGGRKGRDSRELIEAAKTYARYLDAHPQLGQRLVRITYLIGIDSLEVTEGLFSELARINGTLRHARIVPWLSVFTAYSPSMRLIQQRDFGLDFILRARELAEHYFGKELLEAESGGTVEGYARGLY